MRRQTWQDAYDAQMGLWRWYRTDHGHRFLQANYAANTNFDPSVVENAEALKKLIAGLLGAEERKVLAADPIFVSSEMVDVIEAAAAEFKPEPLFSTDVLTHTGFCWFERPFLIADRFDEELLLRGWSWCRMESKGPAEMEALIEAGASAINEDGVVLSMTRETEDPVEGFEGGLAITLYADWEKDTEAVASWRPGMGSAVSPLGFAPMHVTPWWFGMTFEGNEIDAEGKPTGAGWWWRILQVTLRLMQQRIAVTHAERAGRPQRREAKREGWDDREVLVVRLRRERGEHHEPSGEEAGYSHRFIVGGHWRNQWYPSGQVHRQIWISPYVKGPDDKPLVVKPRRAYTWDR